MSKIILRVHITKNTFSDCFKFDEDVEVQFKRWQRKLYKAIQVCFRIVRIKQDVSRKRSRMEELMDIKKLLLKKRVLQREDEERIDEIENEITKEIADMELEKIERAMGDLDSDTNKNIWKELRKAYPKNTPPIPTGVKTINGRVITNPNEKRNVTLQHFLHRMRNRETKIEVKEIRKLHSDIFKERLEKARHITSPPFSMT